jgi:septum site-determining protein MinC
MAVDMEALSKSRFAEMMRAATRSRAAFELKGVVTPLTVLRLRTRDLNLVERQLRAKLVSMPGFFQDSPVVLDLGALEGSLADLPLAALVHVLRSMGVVPVGATGVPDEDRESVLAAGLGIVNPGPGRERDVGPRAEEPPPEPERRNEPARAASVAPLHRDPHRPPLVVRQAVRGGQEIYARQTDLIVLAPVNPGAQIYADGHIHVYSTLRGRAMAGAQGMTEARVFVQKLEAELVAIAGAYVMADDIPSDRRSRPSQVYLENGECRIAAL